MTNLGALRASTVYDKAGDKLGRVEYVYLSGSTGRPAWVAVAGLVGSSISLIPLIGAVQSDARLTVEVTRAAVVTAPHLDSNTGITVIQDRELQAHYQISTAQ